MFGKIEPKGWRLNRIASDCSWQPDQENCENSKIAAKKLNHLPYWLREYCGKTVPPLVR